MIATPDPAHAAAMAAIQSISKAMAAALAGWPEFGGDGGGMPDYADTRAGVRDAAERLAAGGFDRATKG